MPTLRAVRSNPRPRALCERLVAAGKPKELALVAAAARRLVLAIFSVVKNRRAFVARPPAEASA